MASATVMQVDISGSVSSGNDNTDYFGTGSADLTGDSYTLSYVYNTSAGAPYNLPGQVTEVYGPGVISATLTINGTSFHVAGSASGSAQICDSSFCDPGGYDRVVYTTYDYSGDTAGQVNNYVGLYAFSTDSLPLDLTASLDLTSISSSLGQFNGYNCVYDTSHACIADYNFNGFMTVDSVHVSGLAPVPLPAGAGLLAGALGALGLLRRRKARQA